MDHTKELMKDDSVCLREDAQTKKQVETVGFTELYRRHANSVFCYLFSRVQNVSDAEDLTSQTFITALENLPKLRDPQKFTPWVFRIARNKAADFFRKNGRHPVADYNEELDQINREKEGFSQVDQDRLYDLERLISSLGAADQEYLRLRIVAELPFAEIAAILNEPDTRIKKKYYRLLDRLQTEMEKYNE